MINQQIKAEMIKTLESALPKQTSKLIRESLIAIVKESMNNAHDVEEGLNKIRITIRLFISEALSAQVYKELRKLAGIFS